MFLTADQWWRVFLSLSAISDWHRARYAAEQMLQAISASGDNASRRYRWAAKTFLAEALAKGPTCRDDLQHSEQLYRDALELSRALARELDTPEARRDVSVSLNNVGPPHDLSKTAR